MLSEESVWNVLHAEVTRRGGQKAAAKRLGVSAQHLCDVFHGRRALSAKLLAGLGYRRVTMYERVGTDRSAGQ